MRKEIARLACLLLALGIGSLPANAEVVCRKKSGALAVREACKTKETPFDLASLQPARTAAPTPPRIPQWKHAPAARRRAS